MPYYRIDISLQGAEHGKNRGTSVIRQYKEADIERVWQLLENKSREKWGSNLKDFNCVQVSKRSADYQRYLKQLSDQQKNKNSFAPPAASGTLDTRKHVD